jgi:hypothetical protein
MGNLLTILVILLISLRADAGPEPGLAIKGGGNVATLAHDYRTNLYGFSGGLGGGLQWRLDHRWSLAGQLDLLYAPRGAEIFDTEYLGRVRQNYLDLTAAARPELQLGRTSIYLLVGGGLNFLLSASQEDISGTKRDIANSLRRVDLALLVGGGVAVNLPPRGLGPLRLGTVFLEGRHDRGLIDVSVAGDGFKNRTTSLMLGMSFALGSGV